VVVKAPCRESLSMRSDEGGKSRIAGARGSLHLGGREETGGPPPQVMLSKRGRKSNGYGEKKKYTTLASKRENR